MAEAEPEPLEWPPGLESRQAKLDPFGWYRQQLEVGPVHFDEDRNCWDVFSYDATTTVLTDHETYSSTVSVELKNADLPNMLYADPPEHGRLRTPFTEFFHPDEVESLKPHIEQTAQTLLREAESDGDMSEFDFVDDFATPLPIHIITDILGVPDDDKEQFKEWSDAVIADGDLLGLDPENLDNKRAEAAIALAQYFMEICTQRRENPQDDLISKVIHDSDLTNEEVLGLSRMLLIAGNITTTNLITNTLWCLLEAGDLKRVQQNPDLLSGAIEETLRYRSPSGRAVRRATRDTELCGRQIKADDWVTVWFGAANRDPDQFENPDHFDITRTPNPHLAFGQGIHACLGAPLARTEALVALKSFLRRYDSISPIETEYEPYTGAGIYGVQQFPITVE